MQKTYKWRWLKLKNALQYAVNHVDDRKRMYDVSTVLQVLFIMNTLEQIDHTTK